MIDITITGMKLDYTHSIHVKSNIMMVFFSRIIIETEMNLLSFVKHVLQCKFRMSSFVECH